MCKELWIFLNNNGYRGIEGAENMRLFIAINFEENIKNKIQGIIKEVKESSLQGRFVSNEHMHLTLEFLGEIPEDGIREVEKVMAQIDFETFTMKLKDLGSFKRRDGDIYWLGIQYNEELLKLQSRLHERLIEEGFKLEARPYKPHITIGRKVKMDNNFDVERLSDDIKNINIEVDKIDLMKSERIGGRLVYSIVKRFYT